MKKPTYLTEFKDWHKAWHKGETPTHAHVAEFIKSAWGSMYAHKADDLRTHVKSAVK